METKNIFLPNAILSNLTPNNGFNKLAIIKGKKINIKKTATTITTFLIFFDIIAPI